MVKVKRISCFCTDSNSKSESKKESKSAEKSDEKMEVKNGEPDTSEESTREGEPEKIDERRPSVSAPDTGDPIRLKCRELLCNALKSEGEY